MVLSEEGADNPARLGARRVWIVDPLDGTREFGEPGRTDWAVHVALWERANSGDGGAAASYGDETAPSPRRPDPARSPSPPKTSSCPRSSRHPNRNDVTLMRL